MQPLRLLVVAAAMIAVLALVAGFAATSDRVERQRTATATVAPGPAPEVKALKATLPSAGGKPIEMRVGDTLTLTVTLPEDDKLELPEFGLEESIAGKIPTQVLVTAPMAGTFPFKLQNTGKTVGELKVLPARTSTAPTPATPEDETPAAPSSELGTPSR